MNVLARYDPQERWQLRIKFASRLLGCYDTLAQANLGEE
jgi:hypothetical protein